MEFEMQSARDRIESLVPKACAVVQLSELTDILGIQTAGSQITRQEAAALSVALNAAEFAMEPDPRFGGPVPTANTTVTVFRQKDTPADMSFRFFVERTHVGIAALAASNDGEINAAEAQAIVAKIKAMPALSNPERVRLIAYLSHLTEHPPSSQAIANVQERKLKDRQAIGRAAVAAVAADADGQLGTQEVSFLERTFDKLHLPKDQLTRNVEALSVPAQREDIAPNEPRGQRQEATRTDHRDLTRVQLDPDRIAKILEETRNVSAILGEVFEDDPSPEGVPHAATKPVTESLATEVGRSTARFLGLEPRHARVLEALVDRASIDPDEFARLARKHGLMPAGAMEAINEWSFQQFDEPVLEDGDSIEIAHHLLRPQKNAA